MPIRRNDSHLYGVSSYEYAISTLRTECLKFYNLCTVLADFTDMALRPQDQRHQYLRYEENVWLGKFWKIQWRPRIMPPKIMKRKAVKKMVKRRIAEAIEEYENTRANPGNVGRSGPANTRGTVNVQGPRHPIVTIPLLPDFGGVTDGIRAKNPSSLSDIHARVFPDPYLLFRLIMPPKRFKKKSVRKIVEKCMAKSIEKYEKTRADLNNAGGSGSTNTGGTVVPEMHGCSYKTFMNGKPHSFKGLKV
ncbi:hypothetical protein Tco_0938401 [Tanacetum coccineum]|uniref:Uncharacterized protein n=1 Tax=Tanacetum coccineum TaxID=301880 RepID=A0ABQ5DJR9_9ASTR